MNMCKLLTRRQAADRQSVLLRNVSALPRLDFKMGVRLSRLQASHCNCGMEEKKIMVKTVMGKRIRRDKILKMMCVCVLVREKHSFTSLIWSAPPPCVSIKKITF